MIILVVNQSWDKFCVEIVIKIEKIKIIMFIILIYKGLYHY
jgi:hypothetical protein